MTAPLYIVHCIDTEGPLYESLDATFDRVESLFGVRLDPTRENLARLRRKEIDLGGKEDAAATVVSEHLLDYNDTWDKVDDMLYEMLGGDYRQRYADSRGNGWVYSWFLLDHVGYDTNPRRRDIGYHNVFDHYRTILRETGSEQDDIQFHFHPMTTYKEAHVCATSYIRSPHLWETLSRRIIDRGWFPSCFRPGFHVERPDSHWFLEQWIPFDFANQGMDSDEGLHNDIAEGRLGDWRRAPRDWSHYHPHHDDYQIAGNCNRTIFRCLNIGTRYRLLSDAEVRKAFERAASGAPTILAFTNHDFRDMRPDVDGVHQMLLRASQDYPDVKWLHARARDAARAVLGLNTATAFELQVELETSAEHPTLHIRANQDTFGPQPFLAIRTRDGRYLSDNLDFQEPRRYWTYTLGPETVLPDGVDKIAVASNALSGQTAVATCAI